MKKLRELNRIWENPGESERTRNNTREYEQIQDNRREFGKMGENPNEDRKMWKNTREYEKMQENRR